MCLLTFLPPGVQPHLPSLTNGSLVNDDGHGFAIVTGDGLLVHRGMDAVAVIDAFAEARSRYPAGPALFHSRFGTHGHAVLANCHPLRVGGDDRTVIAHNGVLPAIVQPAKKDPRSDTRIAAEVFLPAFGPLHRRGVRLRLQRWMGKYNKMVILTVDRRFREHAYLLNEAAGTWDGGIWYSNDGYLPAPGYHFYDDWWAEELASRHGMDRMPAVDTCANCCALTSFADGYCHTCGCCLDCRQPREECLCYTPSAPNRTAWLTGGDPDRPASARW
ncbi:hypothetical protein GCM10023170_097000 [Phytohabitans houttuyneae]|uniref:hypothetical protein n=1 Tax=Phytohabitans houttuyneae TaxID=1076126 RepID=UPI0031EAC24E